MRFVSFLFLSLLAAVPSAAQNSGSAARVLESGSGERKFRTSIARSVALPPIASLEEINRLYDVRYPQPIVSPASGLRIVLIVDGADSEPFWTSFYNGTIAAARQTGAQIEFRNSPTANPRELSLMARSVMNSPPDVLLLAVGDFAPFAELLQQARQSGIIVLTAAGLPYESLEQWGHIGASPQSLKSMFEQRIFAGNARPVIWCIVRYLQNLPEKICSQLAQRAERPAQFIETREQNASDSIAKLLQQDIARDRVPDWILVWDSGNLDGVLEAVAEFPKTHTRPQIAARSLSVSAVRALRENRLAFALEQQPFLQGYYAVLSAGLHKHYGLLPPAPLKQSTGFVTRQNAFRIGRYLGTLY